MAAAEHGAGRYFGVWIALLVLAAASFLIARAHPAGAWAIVIALGIASVKSLLVLLFFMHLIAHRGASRLAIGVAFSFLVVLTLLTIADVATRFPVADPPESFRARHELAQQPPAPWTGEENQQPDRQPHYQDP